MGDVIESTFECDREKCSHIFTGAEDNLICVATKFVCAQTTPRLQKQLNEISDYS